MQGVPPHVSEENMKLIDQYRGLRRENYVLFFGRIVTSLGSMIWPVLTLILNQKMGLDASSIAVLLTAASIVMLPANLFGGRLADRRNKKNIIIVGDLVSIVCYIACGLVPLGPLTIGLIMVASLFQTIEGPAYNALVADITPTRDREKAYSLLYLGANIGMILAPTIAGFLMENYLWLSFIISGVSIGMSTFMIWKWVQDITPVKDEGEEAVYQTAQEKASVFSVLKKNPQVMLFLIATALYYAAYHQYEFLMPLDMAAVHENSAVIFGTVTSTNCIVVVLFTPIITSLFRRMCDTKKLLTGMLLILAGYGLFLALLGFIPAYYASMLVFTWGEVFCTLAEGPYMTARIPSSHRGRVNSVIGVLQTLLIGGFDIVLGRIYDNAGSLQAWILVLGALLIAIIIAAFLIRGDRKAYPKLYE